jgi:hypothetical protein
MIVRWAYFDVSHCAYLLTLVVRSGALFAAGCRAGGFGWLYAVVLSVIRPRLARLVSRSASAALPPRDPTTVCLAIGVVK